jgi:hypothetical protein
MNTEDTIPAGHGVEEAEIQENYGEVPGRHRGVSLDRMIECRRDLQDRSDRAAIPPPPAAQQPAPRKPPSWFG